MNKENKHCCLIPIVTLYNVLRHVINYYFSVADYYMSMALCNNKAITITSQCFSKRMDDAPLLGSYRPRSSWTGVSIAWFLCNMAGPSTHPRLFRVCLAF